MRDDLRRRLLGLKRAELGAVMAGRPAPQPLAAMLFRCALGCLGCRILVAGH